MCKPSTPTPIKTDTLSWWSVCVHWEASFLFKASTLVFQCFTAWLLVSYALLFRWLLMKCIHHYISHGITLLSYWPSLLHLFMPLPASPWQPLVLLLHPRIMCRTKNSHQLDSGLPSPQLTFAMILSTLGMAIMSLQYIQSTKNIQTLVTNNVPSVFCKFILETTFTDYTQWPRADIKAMLTSQQHCLLVHCQSELGWI